MSVKSNTKNKSRINSQKMFFDEIASEEDENEQKRPGYAANLDTIVTSKRPFS